MREAILSASRCQVTKMTKVNYFLSMATTKSTPKSSYVFPSDILNTHCVAWLGRIDCIQWIWLSRWVWKAMKMTSMKFFTPKSNLKAQLELFTSSYKMLYFCAPKWRRLVIISLRWSLSCQHWNYDFCFIGQENRHLRSQNRKLHENLEALDGGTKLSNSDWKNGIVCSGSTSQSQFDDHSAVQDIKTSATNMVQSYEAIIARLEERLSDAHSTLKDLKCEVASKSDALFKVSLPC